MSTMMKRVIWAISIVALWIAGQAWVMAATSKPEQKYRAWGTLVMTIGAAATILVVMHPKRT